MIKNTRLMLSFFSISATLLLCERGLGLPNHPYQIALGVVFAAISYHQGWLLFPKSWISVVLFLGNSVNLAMISKLVVGSGRRMPFSWMGYPVPKIESSGQKWFEIAPTINWDFQPFSFSTVEWDLTQVQTFLLFVTVVGGLFGFQPFVSFAALMLVLASIPALSSFDWNFVFPALLAAMVSLYLQSPSGKLKRPVAWLE